jgi:hypothetical protein
MSSMQHFSKTTKAALLIASIAVLAIGVAWYMTALRPPKTLDLSEIGNKREVPFDPDPGHLNTLAVPEAIRSHLLDGDFALAYHMQDISKGCRVSLNSSFLKHSGATPKNGEINFADPRQPVQYGDVLIPDAPFRQLIFAGQGPKTCFIYYQHSSPNHPTYCLAVMNEADRKAIWVGAARKKAESIAELRSFLSESQFDDTAGLAC